MADEIAIKVERVSKSFKLPHEKQSSIKGLFVSRTRGKRTYERQQVLKNISFEIKKGEFFGVVGRNGSGKSTLLKLISQIYTPDEGSITVNGKLTPFIELGVGFNPELSGRDNVYLNGSLLGFGRDEMDLMYEEIVEFAELERFMDQKLKNYSSGMQVRLAFSIAIRANTDILVLDEVLAVGDEAFQRKCNDYFESVKNQGKTIVLVTHSMDSVRKYCSRAIMISDGEIITIGSPDDVANEYSLENFDAPVTKKDKDTKESFIKEFKVELLSPKIVSQNDEVVVKYAIRTSKDIKINIGMDLQNINSGAYIFSSGTTPELHGKGKLIEHIVKFNVGSLNDVDMRVNSSIKDEQNRMLAFIWNQDAPTFIVRRNDYQPGKRTQFAVMFDKGTWIK